jgi:hypothetical protein
MNFDVNRGSRSLMILVGNPYLGNTYRRYSPATPSALIVSLQGTKIAALEQSWSVIVRIESYPFEMGSLTMKSRAMV